MIKRSLITVFVLVLFCFHTNAQRMSALMLKQQTNDSVLNSKTNEFVLNPLPFFVSGFEIGYGIYITETFNFKLVGGYYYSEEAYSYGSGFSNMEGFRAEAQYLMVKPVKRASRYYIGGYLVYKQISLLKENPANNTIKDKLNASAGGIGLILGVRNYLSEGFFLDFNLGGGPTISIDETNAEEAHIPLVNPYKRSINPRAGMSIGILF